MDSHQKSVNDVLDHLNGARSGLETGKVLNTVLINANLESNYLLTFEIPAATSHFLSRLTWVLKLKY